MNKNINAIREWKHPLVLLAFSYIVFETATGLAITFLPFSISTQVIVFVHTGLGVLFLAPALWYQVRHWFVYRSNLMTHFKLSGYVSTFATLVALITGLTLTYQAFFRTKINGLMADLHLISTFLLIASLAAHLIPVILRNQTAHVQKSQPELIKSQQTFLKHSILIFCSFSGIILLSIYAYQPSTLDNSLPEDYNYLYGEDRPFAPSLATTTTGGAFDSRSLGNSETCGTAGCHQEIVEEWEVSAHRYSAMDPAFQAVQEVMAEQNGPESTRYCGGCHDPISLFSGTKNIFNEDLTNLTGYQEGVSCLVCHSIEKTDIQGNANYTIGQPKRYMFELSGNKLAQYASDFLIRAYPKQHVESLQRKMFKSPEFCGACHKQFIDEEINNVGWVQLQNQYDNWRKSRWNHPGEADKTIECRECHMPLVESKDPASGDPLDYNRSGDDGKHRSHRFLASNQFIPGLLDLPGAEQHTEMTEKWLRGEFPIPEIADKWRTGPAVPIQILAPEFVTPGENLQLKVVVTNNKAGHNFPTGPMDIIQSWLKIIVTDNSGEKIYTSGTVDENHFIQPGSFIFKAEPVDQAGNLIDRHNLWEMVGVRYSRALFPGFSDQAEYSIEVPRTVSSDITVQASLQYRKIEQNLINFLFGEESGITAPISTISGDSVTISLRKAYSREI